MHKLIRITTVPFSLQYLIKGQPNFMSTFFKVICISSGPKEDLNAVAKYENVEVKKVAMSRRITPLKDLVSLYHLIRLFLKIKPSIVHTHTPKAGILGMLAAFIARVPVRMHTVAGLPLTETKGIKRWLLETVEKITYSCANRVYPNSNVLLQFILEEKFTYTDKVKVIAKGSTNGIDTNYFNPNKVSVKQKHELRIKLSIEEDDFVFIFVGRLVSDKGINELVMSFCQLDQSRSIKLLLVGPLESELDPLEIETKIKIDANPNIIATGFQDDVRPYLAVSDVLVFPSYREGFPNVVMQAGAMELPSIVSNINGCNEIIENGVNGIIVPPKNTKILEGAMQILINDDELHQHLKANARRMIYSRFEQNLVWEALLEEYKELLEKKGLSIKSN